jgi:hypothetical protein
MGASGFFCTIFARCALCKRFFVAASMSARQRKFELEVQATPVENARRGKNRAGRTKFLGERL